VLVVTQSSQPLPNSTWGQRTPGENDFRARMACPDLCDPHQRPTTRPGDHGRERASQGQGPQTPRQGYRGPIYPLGQEAAARPSHTEKHRNRPHRLRQHPGLTRMAPTGARAGSSLRQVSYADCGKPGGQPSRQSISRAISHGSPFISTPSWRHGERRAIVQPGLIGHRELQPRHASMTSKARADYAAIDVLAVKLHALQL